MAPSATRVLGVARLKEPALWIPLAAACVVVGVYIGRHSDGAAAPLMLACAMVLLAIVAPQACLYALVALVPFSFRYFLPNRTELRVPSEPIVAALVGAYLLDRVVAYVRGRPAERMPLWAPLAFYAFVTLVSVTQSASAFGSAKGAARAMAYILLPLVTFSLLRDRRTLLSVLAAALAGALVAVSITVAILCGRTGALAYTSGYVGTPFANYSLFGTYVIAFLLPLLALTMFDVPRRQVYQWILLAVFSVAMLLCLSRGAWISLLTGLGFLLVHRSPTGARRKVVTVVATATALTVVMLLPGVAEYVGGRAATVVDVGYGSNRMRLLRWGFALLLFAQRPLLGHGYGSFALTYENESFLSQANVHLQLGAHNQYLQILAEMGLVGILAWAWLIVAALSFGIRALRSLEDSWLYSLMAGVIAFQVACLVHFLAGSFLAADVFAVPFWLTFGVVPAIARIDRSEREIDERRTSA